MSLNWREIDLLLDELSLAGSHIRQIHQPSHERLTLELFDGRTTHVLISLANRHCRLHRLTRPLKNPQKPPRFVSFLRARIKGGRIREAGQVAGQRIVKLTITAGGATLNLWIRLWGSAANIIVTDADGKILEVFYRRPKRGEVAGGHYDPESQLVDQEPTRDYQIRDLPGDGDFNTRIEGLYFDLEEQEERDRLKKELAADLTYRENGLENRRRKLEKQRDEYANPVRSRQIGDLLKSALHTISAGDTEVEVEDYNNGGAPLVIRLDPKLTPAQNAESYYKKYSTAAKGLEHLKEELESLELAIADTARQKAQLEAETALETLRLLRDKTPRQKSPVPRETPGLHFNSGDHNITVGRTSRDNDALLRGHVGGNDYWFHARDWPGAYVFVKSHKGKSIPLDTMLDAGNLAIFYSKGRSSGAGDIYYTQVKYLRRVRGGKVGLVLPTREKNLHIKLEEDRLNRLRRSQEAG